MSPLEAIALVSVAVLGPGGLAVALVSARRTRAQVERVAESVGPVNSHGTVQQQSGRIASEIDSMHVTLNSLVGHMTDVSRRLDGHDREHASADRRLTALEAWQHAFHVDDDERLG